MSQEGQKVIENQILRKCNPQEIARELLRELEKKAAEAANKGECSASTRYSIWYESINEVSGGLSTGPLVDFSDRDKAAKILLEMVQKHITDENIQIELYPFKYKSVDMNEILAKIEW